MQKQTIRDWMNHPVTRVFFKVIKYNRDTLSELMVTGNYLGEDKLVEAGRVVGEAKVMNNILSHKYIEDETLEED